MPILAIPVVGLEEEEAAEGVRTLAFRALDGTYPLPSGGTDFFFMPDITGLDKPPQEVITKRVPGMEGERVDEVRVLRRDVFLPLWMEGLTHAEYMDRRDLLARLFNHRLVDYRTEDGTLDLVATSIRGTRALRCLYLDGMTGGMWPNESKVWAKLGITLAACRPYWFGTPWTSPVIQQAGGVEPDFFAEFPGELSAGSVLGDNVLISVDGDVESWMTVQLTGPATSIAISGEGNSVSIPAGLGAGETARIVTDPRGRTAQFDGVTNWSRIGPTTTWKALQPGIRQVSIIVSGSTTSTQAVISGPTQFERPW